MTRSPNRRISGLFKDSCEHARSVAVRTIGDRRSKDSYSLSSNRKSAVSAGAALHLPSASSRSLASPTPAHKAPNQDLLIFEPPRALWSGHVDPLGISPRLRG